MQNNFYVYEHIRKDTKSVFYVGKGRGKRIRDTSKRSDWWKKIVAKCGVSVRFVAGALDEELAFLVEVERIDQLKRIGVSLCNLTSGGEGASGAVRSAETKERMGAWQRGRKLPAGTKEKLSQARKQFTGWSHQKSTKAKMSKAKSGAQNPMYGKEFSDEHRARISKAGVGRRYPPGFGDGVRARQLGELNHNYGRVTPEGVRDAISKSLKGRSRPQKTVQCPHCGLTGGMNAMTRHHFDNCRHLVAEEK